MVAPGRDLSTSAVRCHSGGTSPTSRPRARAISRPRMRPVNMAADASAISSESPAAKTGRPNSFALATNSSTGSRPTATSTVSHWNVCSVPRTGFHALSIFAMVTDVDLFGAVRAEHRVRGVDGHAHPHELVLVHLVAAALGQRLAQPHHLDAGLQRVVAGDEPDVAAADDEQPRRSAAPGRG